MRDAMLLGGVILIFLGVFAVIAQAGNFVDYRRMRHLKRHGIDGRAVYARHEYVTNSHRVFFDVCLPEGQPPARFHQYMQALPGPEGTMISVVYDRRKPKRARAGVREEMAFDEERPIVMLLGGGGLALIGVGALICLVGSLL